MDRIRIAVLVSVAAAVPVAVGIASEHHILHVELEMATQELAGQLAVYAKQFEAGDEEAADATRERVKVLVKRQRDLLDEIEWVVCDAPHGPPFEIPLGDP